MFFNIYDIHIHLTIFCKKYKKKIKFNNIVNVILIPDITTFFDIKNLLWWNESDLLNSVNTARNELHNLINRNPSMTLSQAKKLLYQPNNISFNEENFI